MKTRVITSVVGLAVLAGVLALFDTVVFDLVLAAICMLAIWEVFHALGFTPKQRYLLIPVAIIAVMVMLSHTEWVGMAMLPAFMLLVLFLSISMIAHSQTISFEKLGALVYYAGVIILCFYSLVYLKRCLPPETYHSDAIYFILLILCFAWGGDTGAYFAGRAFGKHKLAPIVSPKKTVEGAVGGVFGSILLGILCTAIFSAVAGRNTGILLHVKPVYYLALVGMGAISSVLGILGDLFASVVKRQHQIKDYGNIFPGHGGVLDRFDSVMFIAPFVSLVVRFAFYYWTFRQ